MATLAHGPTEIGRDQLKIVIDTKQLVSAVVSGHLLAAFDRAFARYARIQTGRRDIHLEILASGKGTWWVVLGVAFGAAELSEEHPDLLPLFMHDLSIAMKVAMDHGIEDTPEYLRDLLRTIIRSVRNTTAKSIDIVSTVRIMIHAHEFEHMDISVHRNRKNDQTADELSAPVELAWSRAEHAHMISAGQRAKSGNLRAKLHKVGQMWYANADGMHGVLLPLELSILARSAAADGKTYMISGDLGYSGEGHPIAIKVDILRLIGPGPDETVQITRW